MFRLMKVFLTRDSLLTGLTIGLITTALLYFSMGLIIDSLSTIPEWLKNPRTPFLIALIPNVFLFRYYMVNRKQDKTGRGIILVLFVVIFAVFLLIK